MAYDEGLAQRVREFLGNEPGLSEKKMFGGLAFLIHGHMSVGIVRNELMVRVGAQAYPKLLQRPEAREMDFTGRPMRGFLYIGAEPLESDDILRDWIEYGAEHARSLPPK